MLSVVVLNKNRLNYLALKIQSLMLQVNFQDLDILVVDYSDTDEAVEYCRRRKIRCIRVHDEFSIASARNVGIRHARREWISISGNDTIIDRDYFTKLAGLVRAFRNHKVFFSGSFVNFVRKRQTQFNDNCINLTFAFSRLFSAMPGMMIDPFRSLQLPACFPPVNGGRASSMPEMIHRAGQSRFGNRLIHPVLSWHLLQHLLDVSPRNDDCLASFYDRIFSRVFLKGKEIRPYTFQTFNIGMAEELNGYDESFEDWGAEDVDFKIRARRHGYIHIPTKLISLHLEHPVNRTMEAENYIRRIMQGRGRLVQPRWGLSQAVEEIA